MKVNKGSVKKPRPIPSNALKELYSNLYSLDSLWSKYSNDGLDSSLDSSDHTNRLVPQPSLSASKVSSGKPGTYTN